jgi:hypothetical protein
MSSSIKMKPVLFKPIALLITLFLSFTGCGQQNPQDNVVTWPQLRVLDEIAETVMNHSGTEDSPEIQNSAVELFGAAKMVCESEVPGNAKNTEQVKLLQNDLSGLIGDEISSLSQDDLKERVNAIHAVAVKLMQEAGMPHIHDHEDHEGHNH